MTFRVRLMTGLIVIIIIIITIGLILSWRVMTTPTTFSATNLPSSSSSSNSFPTTKTTAANDVALIKNNKNNNNNNISRNNSKGVVATTTAVVVPVSFACSYTIFTDGNAIYAKNCNTGTIDYKGTDAATVINSAMQSGHKIFIKQGNYIITKPINILHGVTLQGESPSQAVSAGNAGTHLKLARGSNINMIQYNGTSLAYMVTIEDMFLDGDKANNSAGNGIYLNNKINDVLIQNVYIDGFAQNCALFDQTWNYRLLGDTFEHCAGDGLYAKRGSDLKIIGNKFLTNSKYGLQIGTPDNGGVDSLMLEGNYIQGNSKNGVVLQNSPDAVISGNIFEINSYRNPGKYDDILLLNDDSFTKIIGNAFIGSNETRNAIRITHPSCSQVLIADNSIHGFTEKQKQKQQPSSPITDNGTNTIIRNNVGEFVTEAKGTATIPKGSKTVTIMHGLSYTPSPGEISITEINNNSPVNSPEDIWISGITSKQFTVNIKNEPGTSGFSFGWAIRRI